MEITAFSKGAEHLQIFVADPSAKPLATFLNVFTSLPWALKCTPLQPFL